MLHLAVGTDPLRPTTALLACDALAQAIVNVAWNDPQLVQKLDHSCFGDPFLRRVTMPLTWFLRDAPERPNEFQCQAAKGAVRVLRAALTFERGLIAFTSCAQAVCRLTREDEETSAESYLALEAYAHGLYTSVCTEGSRDGKLQADASASRAPDLAPDKADDSDQLKFIKDQLSELIPVAFEASRVFVSHSEAEQPIRKAAAGHFAATLLAISAIPLDQTVLQKLLSECSAASRKIKTSFASAKPENLGALQALASVSHAGARTLARVQLDSDYVRREVECLMDGVRCEYRCLSEDSRGHICLWRPTSNACAEWIGLFAKVSPGVEAVKKGVDIICWISDPQVILDILARCVLRAGIVVLMNPALTIENAQKCAEDLLPLTLAELCQMSNSLSLAGKLEGSGGHAPGIEVLVTIEGVLNLWVKHEEVWPSFFCIADALFENDALEPNALFRVLLKAPTALYTSSPELFRLLLAAGRGALRREQPLFQSKRDTVVSTVSTSPNSELTTSLLSMSDFLVTRGPTPNVPQSIKDPLASVMLSVMCGPEADDSLRTALWKKTVEECGGAILYASAVFLFDQKGQRIHESSDEEDTMLTRYCNALQHGLLAGQKCPPVLGTIIVSAMGRRVENWRDHEPLLMLQDALGGARRTIVLDALQGMLSLASGDERHTSAVANWVTMHVTK